MEGTGDAHDHCNQRSTSVLAPGGFVHESCGCTLLALVVQPSYSSSLSSISPTSPSLLLQCDQSSYGDTNGAGSPPNISPHEQLQPSGVGSDGDYMQPRMSSPSHCTFIGAPHTQQSDSSPAYSANLSEKPLDELNSPSAAALPNHCHQAHQISIVSPPEIELPSHRCQQQYCSSPSPLPASSSTVPCTLDPNAREFTPSLLPTSFPTIQAPVMQPVYTAHSEVRVSVCYQSNIVALQGRSCNNFELVDTNLRLGLPISLPSTSSPEIVTANDNTGASTIQYIETSPSPCTESLGQQFTPYTDLHHVGGSGYVEDAPNMAGFNGILASVHERPSLPAFNPPILANPSPVDHVGFLPAMAMGPPSLPHPMPLVHTLCPSPPDAHQQALTVYTHKHFHPHYGWKEHISRAILISGIPSHLYESQLCEELEHWGHIRALQVDKLSQGMLSVQFFDLRAARQALRDMQNQHLLRQQRFQQHLYAQSGMQFHSCSTHSGADGEKMINSGLLCGNVVWAQYVAAWSVPVPDGHNQGTLVLFNVGIDVNLQNLRQVFEKFGDVRELREAPTKRQHKFVEFYDTRDAEAAWAALNGQEVCGKCIKIEFSRQGGPARKQKSVPVQVHHDMVAIGNAGTFFTHGQMSNTHESSTRDPALCGWQNNGLFHQEWRTGFFQGDSQPFPRPETLMLPNRLLGPDNGANHGPSRCFGRYVSGGKGFINHMQGTVAGPRRKQSGLVRSHLKLCHGVIQPTSGNDKSYALTYDSRRIGAVSRNASTRGHPHFEYDEREVYLISGQQRTTLMIKNIPNKYSQQMLLAWLDHHCVDYNSRIVDSNEPESAYDFVYLPIDFKNRCNLGYAFVNFTTALATLKFYKAFHAQAWEAFNSKKICEIKYARVQGRSALENHFCNSRFACDTVEYLPVVFVPPRNGFECPQPRVAAGMMVMKCGRQGFGAARTLLLPPCSGEGTILSPCAEPVPETVPPSEKPSSDSDSSTTEGETETPDIDENYVDTTSAHA